MTPVYGTCPNPDCNATIRGSADVERITIGSLTRGGETVGVYAIACKACTWVMGTIAAPR